MKIAVLGAGAMGSIYGGFLSQGNDVWLVDIWKEHVDAINSRGLTILEDGREYVFHPHAVTSGAQAGVCELVIVFVKSVSTAQALQSNKELFGDNTLVLTLQNGYGNGEDIEKFVPPRNIVLGTTHHGGNVLGPGRIQHNGRSHTYVGVKSGDMKNAERIAEALRGAGFDAQATDDAVRMMWTKLLSNCAGNAITALLGVKNGYMAENDSSAFLFEAIIREGVKVAAAEGIMFDADETVANALTGVAKVGENRSSMLQDVAKKRKTEIERLNGALMELGARHGIDVPYNTMTVKLIQGMEAAYGISERYPENV